MAQSFCYLWEVRESQLSCQGLLLSMKLGVGMCNSQIKQLPVKVLDDPTHIQALVLDLVETPMET
jgi:hypothetical protein